MLKHGFNRVRTQGITRFYRIWIEMKGRCNNKNRPHYKHYGGRGIRCSWDKFEDFRDDMYESYLEHVKIHGEKNSSIERLDNNGNYYKENCRWATQKEQTRNSRKTVWITLNGERKSFAEWAEKVNINYHTLYSRIFEYGWSIEKALLPHLRRVKKHDPKGSSYPGG